MRDNNKKRKLNEFDNEESINLEKVRFLLKNKLDMKKNNNRCNTPIVKRQEKTEMKHMKYKIKQN